MFGDTAVRLFPYKSTNLNLLFIFGVQLVIYQAVKYPTNCICVGIEFLNKY